jgi:hypothetical protein
MGTGVLIPLPPGKGKAMTKVYELMTMQKPDSDLLYLFHGECGHQWVGAVRGSYQCPVCGLWDGDHHLTSMDPIPVQVNDWGSGVWKALAEASNKAWAQSLTEARQ